MIRHREYGLATYKKDQARRDSNQEAEQRRLEAYEAMRDDLMSAVKNSGLSFEVIHARCGPCPWTLNRWAERKTRRPQMAKMISVMRIIGLKEFVIRL